MKVIKKKIKNKYIKNYLLATADIETCIHEGIHTPIALGYMSEKHDPKIFKTKDIKMSKSIIKDFLSSLDEQSDRWNTNIILYFHNGSNFDLIIIMKEILNKYPSKVITRSNKFFELTYKNVYGHQILIRDSLHILPMSLSSAAKTINQKKIDFEFENITTDNISSKYSTSFWVNLIKYLSNDILILFRVIIKYRSAMSNSFTIDCFDHLTIPSLTLNLYISKYMPEESIYRLTENQDNFVRKSYLGGISDVYKFYGENLVSLDVNSLYPASMRNNPMPVGKGEWVYDQEELKKDFFGFLEVEIDAPYSNIPFLPYRDEYRGLINPYGKWSGVYFSEEIKYAVTKGYKIKIIKGLKFRKKNIFKEFIDHLYYIRNNNKSEMVKLVSKLLMNSLYGRFGMKKKAEKTIIVNQNEKGLYYALHSIIRDIKINKEESLLSYHEDIDHQAVIKCRKIFDSETMKILEKYIKQCKINSERVISAPHIASAITSYSRIHMAPFKEISNIYYTDTDSIVIEKKKLHLYKPYISDKLGDFKIEFQAKKGYFVAPKIYLLKGEQSKIAFKGFPKSELETNKIEKWFKNRTEKEGITISYTKVFIRDLTNLNIKKEKRVIQFSSKSKKRIREGLDTKPIKL